MILKIKCSTALLSAFIFGMKISHCITDCMMAWYPPPLASHGHGYVVTSLHVLFNMVDISGARTFGGGVFGV